MVKVVVPFIDNHYATTRQPEDRLLLGYSKSGWGALSLLARNPEVFGYAASWDAPLLLDFRELWGIAEHFGTADQLNRHQPLSALHRAADKLMGRRRFALLGHSLFGPWPSGEFEKTPHTNTAHQRLVEWGIPHYYSNSIQATHHWDGTWVQSSVAALVELSRPAAGTARSFRCDFAAAENHSVTKLGLDAVTQNGGWIIATAQKTAFAASPTGDNHALLVQGQGGTSYRFTLCPAEVFDLTSGAELSFKTALRGGYGAEGRSYGGNRNHILEGRDALSRPIFRLIVVGYSKHGRIGYLDAEDGLHLFEPRLRRADADTYDPEAMHEVRLTFGVNGIAVSVDGRVLSPQIPYDRRSTTALVDLQLYGTNYAAAAFFDDFVLRPSSDE